MEMHDLGDKHGAMVDAPSKKKIWYPRQTFKKDQFPELFSKDIGDMCRAEVVLKVVGKRINEDENSNDSSVEVEVRKVGYKGSAGKKTYSELEDMTPKERAKDREENLQEDK